MATLTDYRLDLNNILATAVDSSTWTTTIMDQAIRMALDELNRQLVYEASFTVAVAGYEQDLSTITAISSVLAVAYPWLDGRGFGECLEAWRITGVNKITFEQVRPNVGELIRVRYTKAHLIQSLDAAVATTVPDNNRYVVGLWGAAYACDLRIRQISENPAIPASATNHLRMEAATFRGKATEAISHVPPLGLRWANLGLE